MLFKLKTPCKECPFLRGNRYLEKKRAEEIANYALRDDMTFACHKTIPEYGNSKIEQQCAGAIITTIKAGRNHRLFSLAHAVKMFDITDMDLTADVYLSAEEMGKAHGFEDV